MKLGGGGIVVLVVVAVVALSAVVDSLKPSAPTKTPAQIEAERKADAAIKKVAGSMSFVKANNRNPDSVVWESVRANDDASVVCIEYRGQNGFGGMTRGMMIVVNTTAYQDAAAWNRFCTTPLQDMMRAKFVM